MTAALHGISKRYLRKAALSDVSVTFPSGKIHALLGENGAGKSTLAGILSGAIRPSSGTLLLDGRTCTFSSPGDARAAGIYIVQQRPLLASSLTAWENILLSDAGSPFLLPRSVPQPLVRLRSHWAPGLSLSMLVRDCGGNNRFYIALLAALLQAPRLLILDEPSAFLDSGERRVLYTSLQELASQGTNIIVITHSTAEAETYADTVTVLNEGRVDAVYASAAEYRAARARDSGGHYSCAVTSGEPPVLPEMAAGQDCGPCLVLDRVACRPQSRPALLNATVTISYGQVTAVSGMKEAAMDTLEDVVCGMEPGRMTGTATLYDRAGRRTVLDLARRRLGSGLLRRHHAAIIPSDRTFRAAHPRLTVEQMLSVHTRARKARRTALRLIRAAGVQIGPEEPCSALSGGMLQRLVVARELDAAPDLVLLCNPMQGLDIQAQGRLARTVAALAASGTAVLVLGTADFPLSLCHRVYALEGGETRLVFERASAGAGGV